MIEHGKDFEVQDRRASKTGSAEQQGEDSLRREPDSPPAPGPKSERAAQPPPGPEAAGERKARQLPEMDFSMFVVSLATSAFIQLGLAVHPELGRPEPPNLPLARQTIDILGILEDKTRGNLTEQEAGLLQQLLFDLRLKFVEVSSAPGSGTGER